MIILKRVAAVLAAIMLTLGLTGAPVYAALSDCPSGYVCLFKNINGGAGRWQGNLSTIANAGCWNLSGSTYTTGGTVNNTSGSMTFDPTAGQKTNNWRIYFRDWVCGTGGPEVSDDLDYNLGVGNLSNLYGQNWYHRITSIEIVVSA
jgi:hypothetical protein